MRRDFARLGLGYHLRLPELATELAVSRLSRRGGDTYGELVVTCGLPFVASRDGHLHQARVNLSSTTSRGAVAKFLTSRAKAEGLDWSDLLEEFCSRVLAAEREGTPVVLVGGRPRRMGVLYRLDPILADGKPVILYGEGGTGKSTLAAALAVSVETGVAVVPGWIPRQAPVLYLDWESDVDEINERVAAVAAGANIPGPVAIRYRHMVRPFADQAEDVAELVAAESIGLVVVDSIGIASGSSADGSDASESAIRLFSAFRILRTTVLAIDHVTKADADDERRPHRPYGSVFKVNLARATFELRRITAPDGASILGIYNPKNNLRRALAPMALTVRHTDDGAVAYEPRADIPHELTGPLRVADQVASVLAHDRLTVEQIAEMLGKSEANVRAVLSREKRRFNRLPSGVWELLPAEVPHAV